MPGHQLQGVRVPIAVGIGPYASHRIYAVQLDTSGRRLDLGLLIVFRGTDAAAQARIVED